MPDTVERLVDADKLLLAEIVNDKNPVVRVGVSITKLLYLITNTVLPGTMAALSGLVAYFRNAEGFGIGPEKAKVKKAKPKA